jgi:hypothetical protein
MPARKNAIWSQSTGHLLACAAVAASGQIAMVSVTTDVAAATRIRVKADSMVCSRFVVMNALQMNVGKRADEERYGWGV